MSGDSAEQIPFETFERVDLRVAHVRAAPQAVGTRSPCRVFDLDVGPLGSRTAVGQYALLEADELVGRNVIVCVNLASRRIGKYQSDALVLGAPHPASPEGQSQAIPIFVADDARPGDRIY